VVMPDECSTNFDQLKLLTIQFAKNSGFQWSVICESFSARLTLFNMCPPFIYLSVTSPMADPNKGSTVTGKKQSNEILLRLMMARRYR
jgi:hypothetical protein